MFLGKSNKWLDRNKGSNDNSIGKSIQMAEKSKLNNKKR